MNDEEEFFEFDSEEWYLTTTSGDYAEAWQVLKRAWIQSEIDARFFEEENGS